MARPLTATSSAKNTPSSLTVSVDRRTGVVVLRGELDRDTARHLEDALTALARTGHACWVVDTAGVTWCDAGGLRALAVGHALALRSGRELRLVRPSRCVDRLVTLSGLNRFLADNVAPRAAATRPGGRSATVTRGRTPPPTERGRAPVAV